MSEILSRGEFEALKAELEADAHLMNSGQVRLQDRYHATIEALAREIDVEVLPDDPDDIIYTLIEKGWLS